MRLKSASSVDARRRITGGARNAAPWSMSSRLDSGLAWCPRGRGSTGDPCCWKDTDRGGMC